MCLQCLYLSQKKIIHVKSFSNFPITYQEKFFCPIVELIWFFFIASYFRFTQIRYICSFFSHLSFISKSILSKLVFKTYFLSKKQSKYLEFIFIIEKCNNDAFWLKVFVKISKLRQNANQKIEVQFHKRVRQSAEYYFSSN